MFTCVFRRVHRDLGALFRALPNVSSRIRSCMLAKSESAVSSVCRGDDQFLSAPVDFLDCAFGLLQAVLSKFIDFNRSVFRATFCGVRYDFLAFA
jgi:hypothetical protein